jgi:hypothetical protein
VVVSSYAITTSSHFYSSNKLAGRESWKNILAQKSREDTAQDTL